MFTSIREALLPVTDLLRVRLLLFPDFLVAIEPVARTGLQGGGFNAAFTRKTTNRKVICMRLNVNKQRAGSLIGVINTLRRAAKAAQKWAAGALTPHCACGSYGANIYPSLRDSLHSLDVPESRLRSGSKIWNLESGITFSKLKKDSLNFEPNSEPGT
ncbi:MAG: hypothetical protein DWQ47_09670 [Acidobacteria bacterium]|nr:MAG: hypothetical protein DWQ32_17770 [Acidobacteriota bacterium]REJ98836.1 MAG: hypothetical protein DWQ38_12205 [Acidobacteriota bacterium]REK16444.1 MAG: hypothetical protein DWQ43_05480 [Acidobacteriota bacterium]REK44125.1 MAG: hypothetical protein DWQ47_09670 [Acidobacteriota bacterium]